MLLSFSVDYMRPYVEAGFRQYSGEDVGDDRVKRQTIRGLGLRNERLIIEKRPDMALHLWWKSRTKQRAFIGEVARWTVQKIVVSNDDGVLNIRLGAPLAYPELDNLIKADGFDGIPVFGEYFVPNKGDVFTGALFKW